MSRVSSDQMDFLARSGFITPPARTGVQMTPPAPNRTQTRPASPSPTRVTVTPFSQDLSTSTRDLVAFPESSPEWSPMPMTRRLSFNSSDEGYGSASPTWSPVSPAPPTRRQSIAALPERSPTLRLPEYLPQPMGLRTSSPSSQPMTLRLPQSPMNSFSPISQPMGLRLPQSPTPFQPMSARSPQLMEF
jgi:hypothetical protein